MASINRSSPSGAQPVTDVKTDPDNSQHQRCRHRKHVTQVADQFQSRTEEKRIMMEQKSKDIQQHKALEGSLPMRSSVHGGDYRSWNARIREWAGQQHMAATQHISNQSIARPSGPSCPPVAPAEAGRKRVRETNIDSDSKVDVSDRIRAARRRRLDDSIAAHERASWNNVTICKVNLDGGCHCSSKSLLRGGLQSLVAQSFPLQHISDLSNVNMTGCTFVEFIVGATHPSTEGCNDNGDVHKDVTVDNLGSSSLPTPATPKSPQINGGVPSRGWSVSPSPSSSRRSLSCDASSSTWKESTGPWSGCSDSSSGTSDTDSSSGTSDTDSSFGTIDVSSSDSDTLGSISSSDSRVSALAEDVSSDEDCPSIAEPGTKQVQRPNLPINYIDGWADDVRVRSSQNCDRDEYGSYPGCQSQ